MIYGNYMIDMKLGDEPWDEPWDDEDEYEPDPDRDYDNVGD